MFYWSYCISNKKLTEYPLALELDRCHCVLADSLYYGRLVLSSDLSRVDCESDFLLSYSGVSALFIGSTFFKFVHFACHCIWFSLTDIISLFVLSDIRELLL